MNNDEKKMQKLQAMILGYVLWAEKAIPKHKIKLKRFINECFLMFITLKLAFPQLMREFGVKKKTYQPIELSEKNQDEAAEKIYESAGRELVSAVELIRNRPAYPREEHHDRFFQIARLYRMKDGVQQQRFEEYLHVQLASDRSNQIWATEVLSIFLRARKVHTAWQINNDELIRKFKDPIRDLTKKLYDAKELDDWAKNNTLIILLGDMDVEGTEPFLLEIAEGKSQLLRAALMSLIKLKPELAIKFLPRLYLESERRLRSDLSFGFGSLGYSTFAELGGLLYYLYGCKYLGSLAEGIHALGRYDRVVAVSFFRALLETSIGTRIYQWYQTRISPHPGLTSHATILANRKGMRESWLRRKITGHKITRVLAENKNDK